MNVLMDIVLFMSSLAVADSLTCFLCGSLSKSCDIKQVSTCIDGYGCGKLQSEETGGKIVLRYCNNGGPEGCGLGTLFGIYGTICQCNTELCNHSPAIRNSHVNIWFAITWVTFKFLF